MPANPHFRRVRIILGDQLNPCHSWFNETNPETLYVIAELISETQYTRHHLQKISAFFMAMADFASTLKEQGHAVCHLTLDDTQQYKSFTELLTALADDYQASHIDYQRPDEYRLLQEFRTLNIAATSIEEFDTEHFLLPFDQLGKHFKQGKSARLEAFYRRLRKQFSILMEGDNPSGGHWNYDNSNRKKFKARDLELLPEPKVFSNDTTEVMQRIHRHNVAYIGRGQQQLNLPTNRQQSLEMLEFFCVNCLPNFGDFQDAMTESSPHAWSLYHSRLSFSLNTKMLNPKEVIGRAIDEYERRQDIDISQIEGFVRQILGWREYIRGIYWRNMPDYATGNCSFSISRTSRTFPQYLIFKPSMIITGLLLFYYWNYNNNLICKLRNTQNFKYKFRLFGILSAIFLIIHSIFLGVKFDIQLYKLFRRVVLLLFIIFELIAQGILVYYLYNIKGKISEITNKKVLIIKICLVSILVIVALASLPILVTKGNTHFKHALEWNYFVGVITFYLLTFFFWKRTT